MIVDVMKIMIVDVEDYININNMKLKNLIKEAKLNEASEIDFKELDVIKQKQVSEFERFFNGKQQRIWEGIHGHIAEIKVPTGKNRLDTKDLKALGNMKLRWIEWDGQIASIGF